MKGTEVHQVIIELRMSVKEAYKLKQYMQNAHVGDSEETIKMKEELFNAIPVVLKATAPVFNRQPRPPFNNNPRSL